MAISGNGDALWQLNGHGGTFLRLTPARDPDTDQLRLDLRWWDMHAYRQGQLDATPQGAAIPVGNDAKPTSRHLRAVRDALDGVIAAIDAGDIDSFLTGRDVRDGQVDLFTRERNDGRAA